MVSESIVLFLLGSLIFLGLLSSCSTPREYYQLTGQVGEYGVQSIEDKKNNIVCYVYRDSDWSSLSCVKKELK